MRVLAIGDAHDGPSLPDKSRFYWIGRYIREHKIRRVVQIGDMFTFDSLCRYDANDTLIGKGKPFFHEDIISAYNALAELKKGLNGYPCHKHFCWGNHEDRINSFTNRVPEIAGMMHRDFVRLLRDYRWSHSPYGEFHFEEGVGFVHVPLNTLGRAYGGKTALTRVANDSTFDIVYGHDHKGGVVRAPKIGHNNYITIYNLGCALPDGHIEDYVGHGATGWQYGIHEMECKDGKIQDYKYISMRELERSYS